MKKIAALLICLLIFFSNNGYSQINSIESFDGKLYSVGDTILGGKSLIGSYLMIRELTDSKSLLSYRKDINHNRLVIQEIVRGKDIAKYSLDDTLSVVRNLEDNKILYIDLRKALRRKEIIAQPAIRLYKNAYRAEIADFQSCCIRTNSLPITDFRLLYYLKAIDKDLGNKCERDEFEYHAVKDGYQKSLEEKVNSFDFNKVYFVDQPMGIGKYDFDKKGFPINFLKLNQRNYLQVDDFYCSIPNLESFRLFSMEPHNANRVNKLRYGNDSYPNNVMYVRCYFKFLDKKMEIKREKVEIFNPEKTYREGMVGLEILGMEFYTDPHMEYNYLGAIK